ncbi:hypothetical protein MY10362_005559 [Beauveria mimosiformis]
MGASPRNLTKSFYEQLRSRDDDLPDLEAGQKRVLDEENLKHEFRDVQFDEFNTQESRITVASTMAERGPKIGSPSSKRQYKSKQLPTAWAADDEDPDEDVPASLLVENNDEPIQRLESMSRATAQGAKESTPWRASPPGAHTAQWETDMQTVSWQGIVARIMALRDQNPKTAANIPAKLRRFMGSQSKERLDAHDIANRLMRKENYLIAMINKDVLNLSLPIPFLHGRQLFSKTMEWYLHYGILDMAFNELGQVQQDFLRADRRRILSEKLRQRLFFAGVLNLVFAPVVLAYVIIVYFFTYYNEYQKDPKLAAARKYTALAEWKFREFNELPHIFFERLHMSFPFATRYVDQFPKRMTEDVARSVAFMSGAITAVLAVCTVLDSELFLGFEITKDRTVLFYLGIFGAIWAMTRGMVSEEAAVFNPEYALRNVIEYTHYMPDHWEGRLHSFEVKKEFAELYKMKVVIFLEEVMGIITTPMLLLFALPKCSDQIVDFFREFTIHVDGLGYVCSFAVFDFKKGVGNGDDEFEDDADDGEGILGESVWETSPAKRLSRENSSANTAEPDAGVLGLIYQLRQTQHGRRGSSMV